MAWQVAYGRRGAFLLILPLLFIQPTSAGHSTPAQAHFLDVVRQISHGNRLEQCPCVRPLEGGACISYDSRYQAATIEEAMFSFLDLTLPSRDALVEAATFRCSSTECRTCFSLLFYRLESAGLIPSGTRITTPLIPHSRLHSSQCPRLRFSAIPTRPPTPPSPPYIQEMIRRGRSNFAAEQAAISAAIDRRENMRHENSEKATAESSIGGGIGGRGSNQDSGGQQGGGGRGGSSGGGGHGGNNGNQGENNRTHGGTNGHHGGRWGNGRNNGGGSQDGGRNGGGGGQPSLGIGQQQSGGSFQAGNNQLTFQQPHPSFNQFPSQPSLNQFGQSQLQPQLPSNTLQPPNTFQPTQNGQFGGQTPGWPSWQQPQLSTAESVFQAAQRAHEIGHAASQAANQLGQGGSNAGVGFPGSGGTSNFFPGTGGSFPSGSFPSGSFPSGSFPGGSFPGGSFPGGSLPGGSFPGGSFPGVGSSIGTGVVPGSGVGSGFPGNGFGGGGTFPGTGIDVGSGIIGGGLPPGLGGSIPPGLGGGFPGLGGGIGGGGGGGNSGGGTGGLFPGGKRKREAPSTSDDHRRDKRDVDLLGNRVTIACFERGENEEEGDELLSLCGGCWSWRKLPSDYFPPLLNELSCREHDHCLSGWGGCANRYRSVSVLRRASGRWQAATLSTATCCDCKVRAGSEIHSLIVA